MQAQQAHLNDIKGFEWDKGNLHKSWLKHGVHYKECEEVFANVPLLLLVDAKHSYYEQRFFVLGRTNNSRLLFIAFTTRKGAIRVISARSMNTKERTIYENAKKIKKNSSL